MAPSMSMRVKITSLRRSLVGVGRREEEEGSSKRDDADPAMASRRRRLPPGGRRRRWKKRGMMKFMSWKIRYTRG